MLAELGNIRAKRATVSDPTRLSEERSGTVNCPELKWPTPFEPFENIDADTQCWEKVQPRFRIYVEEGDGEVIQSKNTEGLTLEGNTVDPIKHLVVIFHGFTSNADVGQGDDYWVHQMANLILEHDTVHQPGLAVLTVDWSAGADHLLCYEKAAANTRYVGVATQRVVKQLNMAEDVYIHCIGHSLGAHTCGFFGNAFTNDTSSPTATESCSSEPADACKAEGGYCGSPGSCPGTVIDNKCPGGQDNKCCTAGMPFQESECEATGGDCLDTCKCPGGNYLHGYCPSQPNSIKCCPRPTEPEPEMCETDTGAVDCSRVTCKSGMISKYISRVID